MFLNANYTGPDPRHLILAAHWAQGLKQTFKRPAVHDITQLDTHCHSSQTQPPTNTHSYNTRNNGRQRLEVSNDPTPIKTLKREWKYLYPTLKRTYQQAGLLITQSATRAHILYDKWVAPYATHTRNIDPDNIAFDVTFECTVFQTYGHTRRCHAYQATTHPLPPSLPPLITLIPPRPFLPRTPKNAHLSALKQLVQSFSMCTEHFMSHRAQLTGNVYTDGS